MKHRAGQFASAHEVPTPRWRTTASRYAAAVAVVGVAALARSALTPVLGTGVPFIFFFPAVIIAGWLGGVGPALVATLLSAAAAAAWLLGPARVTPAEGLSLLLFAASGSGLAALSGLIHRSRRALEAAFAVEARRATELEQWRHVFEHAGWGMALGTPEGRFLEVNQAFADMHGGTPGDWAGRPIADMFAADWRPRLPALLREVEERGHVRYESEHLRGDGRTFPVLTEVTAFKDERGKVLFRAASFQDLSERRGAEQALALEREKLQRLVRTAPFGVVIYEGPDHVTTMSNPKHDEITAHRLVLGRPLLESLPELRGQPVYDVLDEVYRYGHTRAVRELAVQLERAGALRDCWFDVTFQPLHDSDGTVTGVMASAVEVTEHVQTRHNLEAARAAAEEAERLARAITTNATVGLVMMDARQRCTFMNPAAEKIFGYSFTEVQAQGRPLHDIVHHTRPDGSPYPIEDCPIDRALPQRMHEHGEDVFVRRDGTFYPVAFTASPIVEHGRPIGTIIEVADITARKAAEGELRRAKERLEVSEARLRTVIEHAPQGVAVFDREMRYLFASNRWRSDYDLGDTELTGRSHYEVYANQPERWIEAHRRGLAGFVEHADADALLRPDGRVQWLRWEVRPWHDAGGEIGGIIIFAEDITEQKKNEMALRESERQLRELVENLPELAWSARPDGHVDYFNKRWYDFTGATREQMESAGWHAALAPEMAKQVVERWEHALRTGEPIEMEHALRRYDGVFRWFLTRVNPLRDSEGRIVRWFGTNTDITELREAEERARHAMERVQLLAQASTVFMQARLDLKTLLQKLVDTITPRLADGSTVVLRGADVDQLEVVAVKLRKSNGARPPAHAGAVALLDDQAISRKVVSTGHAVLERSAQGSLISVPLRTTRVVLGAVTVVRASESAPFNDSDLTLLQEIADRAALSIEAAQRYREAQEAVQLRDDFLSIASHELRTPLTTLQLQLQGMAQMLTEDGSRRVPTLVHKVETANRQTVRLSRLVEDLLDVTRFSIGHLSLQRRRLDLAALARDIVERHAPEAEAAGCELVVDAAQPVRGSFDRDRIEQLLANLLSNAIKYGPGKPIEVGVSSRGDHALLTVRDHGRGIQPEDVGRLFQRFERAVPMSNYGGLGLGLYLSRQIVEAHGGTIDVSSEPGKGALFTVSLPLRPVTTVEAPRPRP